MRSESDLPLGLVPEQSKVAAAATTTAPSIIISCLLNALECGRQAGRPQAAGEVCAFPRWAGTRPPPPPSTRHSNAVRRRLADGEELCRKVADAEFPSGLRGLAHARASQHQPAF